MKLPKCKNKDCKKPFAKRTSTQIVCSWECSIAYTNQLAEKRKRQDEANKRKEYREAKEKAQPLKYWADKAQIAFNRWIVQRDKDLPCISCGTTNPNIQYAAGHYRTRKAASQLRFNEDNVHKQCNNYCNLKNSGNIVNYRPALIAKIGQERHDALINNNEVKRWTKEELQEVERIYKEKLKQLQK